LPGRRPRLTVLGGPASPRGSEEDGGRQPAGTGHQASSTRAGLELTALGTGLVLTMVLMARLGSWARHLGTFQSLYAIAFAFFALALGRSRSVRVPRAGMLVLAVAMAARIALLPVTPSLSEDIYRYVWEGRVAALGQDPYRLSPRDGTLAGLRDRTIYPRINHPELATIYPPLSIAGYALVARLSPTVWAMKSWVVLHDLALVMLLLAWARARRANPLPVIAYAWNPLVLVEYSGSGHNDPTAMVWLVVALMWSERRPMVAALALAVGTLTKLVPLVALPFLFHCWPWRARLLGAGGIAAGLAWFLGRTRAADSGLAAYGRTWANNELAFHYLARLVHDPLVARQVAAGLLGVALTVLAWRGWDAARGTRFATRAGLVLSPVAHPWYLGWVLVLEPLAPSAPWLLLSLTAVLSYGVLAPPAEGGGFHLSLAWRWFEYGAPLALSIVLALARWVGQRRRADTE
jgi:hypothetical protein